MIQTKVVKVDSERIKEGCIRDASHALRSGGLVIIPTETVYGIAADMHNESAVERLYEIKKRPKDKPFSIVIERKNRIEEFARNIPISAYKLIDKFWPGPLTIILEGINQPSVGLRLPDNEIAQRIIAETKNPVILPSANLSGDEAPLDCTAALKDLNGLVDLAIDAGPVRLGIESSIVDLRSQGPQFLRIGALSRQDIENTINKKHVLFICTGNSCRSVIAEFLFRKMMQDKKRTDVEVASAGIMILTGLHASAGAKEVLSKEGIDASGHISQRVTQEMLKKADLILAMDRSHEEAILRMAPEIRNRVFLLKEFARINDKNMEVADPIGKPLEFYDSILFDIKGALEKLSNLI